MRAFIGGAILFFLLFTLNAFAQEAQEVRAEDKYAYLKALDYLSYIDILTQPVKRHLRKNNIDLNFFAGFLQGFDNNVNLDPDRKKDGFAQLSLNTEVTYNYTDDIRLKVGNDITDILYYNVNSANLFDIYTKAGLETDIFDDLLTVGASYAFDFALFPHDKDGSYLGQGVRVFVKHNILPSLYHKLGYRFLHKGFIHGKTLDSAKARTDTLRKDNRNGMYYEAGYYFLDRAILRTGLEFFRNKSNYEYYDYYNYWSFRIRPSYIVMLTEKLYTSGSFTYQVRKYDTRRSSENDAHVYDNTYTLNASLLYDITKSFTAAASYSYRDNASNEPLQKYSGSIVTAGLYYSF